MKERQYNVPFYPLPFLDPPEKNSGENIVETAGYMTSQQRIEQMIMAGQRLLSARREMYDFEGDIDEDFYDPTRDQNYDMADAFQDGLIVKSKLKDQKEQADLKASQAAQEAKNKVLKEKEGD